MIDGSLRAELAQLMAVQIDGIASPEAHARLELLLDTSEPARQFYVDYLDLHANLLWERGGFGGATLERFAGLPNLPTAVAADDRGRSGSTVLGFLGTAINLSATWLSSPKVLALTVVSCLGTYFVGLMISIAISRAFLTDRRAQDRTESPLVAPARIIAGTGCRWQDRAPRADFGGKLPPGTSRLAEGVVELEFDSGARVSIEGPAEFLVRSGQRMELVRGRLVAYVPKQARGFTVDTPSAEVIDLGTEFGVEVDRRGGTDVHVIQGDVEIKSGSKAGAQPGNLATKLTAGQAARISATRQTASSIPFDGARFTSVLSAEAEMSDGIAGPGRAVDARPLAITRASASSGNVDLHPAAHGNTVRFQQDVDGYTGTDDVMLSAYDNGTTYHQGSENFGAADKIYLFERESNIGNFRRAMVRFDLSSVTPGTRIGNASLTIFLATGLGTKGVTNSLYLVDPANKDWTQAGASWNNKNQAAATPWALWNNKHQAAATPWASGTPGLVAGTDYSTNAVATAASPMRVDEAMTFTLDAAGIAALEDWIAHPASNSGFFLRQPDASSSADGFHSSEAADPALHPLLTLTIDRQAKAGRRDGSAQGNQPDGPMWLSRSGRVKGEFVLFDLGRAQRLGSMRVWNYSDTETGRNNARGVSRADIFVSQSGQGNPLSQPDAWTSVAVDQKFRRADGSATNLTPDVIPLGERKARFVAIVVRSNFNADRGQHPADDRVGLSDVQFFKARSHQ